MPRNSKILMLILSTLTLACFSFEAAGVEPFRQWTGTNGKTITGQLLWSQNGSIYLKDKKTGRQITIGVSNLSQADQIYVEEFQKRCAKENILYQFHLVGERYRKNELGTIPEQLNGLFFVDTEKMGGTLYWTFEPTSPVPESMLSQNATLLISLGNGGNDGTKGEVSIWKNKQRVGSRKGLKEGKRHHIHIPLSSLLVSPTKGKTDNVIELRITAPDWDGIKVWGRNSPSPPSLRIYDPSKNK